MTEKSMLERVVDFLSSPSGQLIVAGLIGGVLRWLHTEKTWRGGLVSILSGMASSWYLGPPAASLAAQHFGFDPSNPQVLSGVAFIVGVGGISVVAFIISAFRGVNAKAFRDKATAMFWSVIEALLHSKGPKP